MTTCNDNKRIEVISDRSALTARGKDMGNT